MMVLNSSSTHMMSTLLRKQLYNVTSMAEVTVVTIGDEDSEKQLRTALAMGADKAVLINTEDDLEDGDQFTTAKILETFFEDKEADLILAGNVAIDESSGQV